MARGLCRFSTSLFWLVRFTTITSPSRRLWSGLFQGGSLGGSTSYRPLYQKGFSPSAGVPSAPYPLHPYPCLLRLPPSSHQHLSSLRSNGNHDHRRGCCLGHGYLSVLQRTAESAPRRAVSNELRSVMSVRATPSQPCRRLGQMKLAPDFGLEDSSRDKKSGVHGPGLGGPWVLRPGYYLQHLLLCS